MEMRVAEALKGLASLSYSHAVLTNLCEPAIGWNSYHCSRVDTGYGITNVDLAFVESATFWAAAIGGREFSTTGARHENGTNHHCIVDGYRNAGDRPVVWSRHRLS